MFDVQAVLVQVLNVVVLHNNPTVFVQERKAVDISRCVDYGINIACGVVLEDHSCLGDLLDHGAYLQVFWLPKVQGERGSLTKIDISTFFCEQHRNVHG